MVDFVPGEGWALPAVIEVVGRAHLSTSYTFTPSVIEIPGDACPIYSESVALILVRVLCAFAVKRSVIKIPTSAGIVCL